MKIDTTKYTNMVNNAASQVKISSTIFKAFIADVKAVVDGNDDLKANKAQEAYTAPTLLNSWVNYGAPWKNAGYYKDEFGIVHLVGVIKSGITAPGTVIFNLPVGYRLLEAQGFSVKSNNGTSDVLGTINVNQLFEVSITAGSNTFLSLNGISFRAEA